jgi:hypothetical protein
VVRSTICIDHFFYYSTHHFPNFQVIVELVDEKDTPPKFPFTRYDVVTAEDTAVGSPVLTIYAIDPDQNTPVSSGCFLYRIIFVFDCYKQEDSNCSCPDIHVAEVEVSIAYARFDQEEVSFYDMEL